MLYTIEIEIIIKKLDRERHGNGKGTNESVSEKPMMRLNRYGCRHFTCVEWVKIKIDYVLFDENN